jgi:hypothetical protein
VQPSAAAQGGTQQRERFPAKPAQFGMRVCDEMLAQFSPVNDNVGPENRGEFYI